MTWENPHMKNYRVQFEDDEVMGDQPYLLCSEHADGVTLFLPDGFRDLSPLEMARVLESAWAGFRTIAHVANIPRQHAYID